MDPDTLLPLGGTLGLFALVFRIWWTDRDRWEQNQKDSDARHAAELRGIEERRAEERADYERQNKALRAEIIALRAELDGITHRRGKVDDDDA